MFDWSECIDMVGRSGLIAVLPHLSADGDALGSAFSLALMLGAAGKNVTVLLEEPPEARLRFLLPDKGPKILIAPAGCEADYDMAIAVDCADRNRLGKRQDVFFRTDRRVKIDHHIERDPFGQLNFVNPCWAAACEGIWEFLCETPFLFDRKLTDPDFDDRDLLRHAAVCLYCGLASDSGSFAYSNTTANTHAVAGALVDFLGDISDYHFRLFDSTSQAAIALKGRAYSKINYAMDGRAALLVLTDEDFTASGADYDDANDIVTVMRSIDGVELAVFARPNRSGRGLKISLRSNREIDAAALAASFGGGGHKRAAGFEYDGDFAQAARQIMQWVETGV